jgi:hypothetical protein
MRYFLDTEFIEDANHLDLISIGLVSEDRRAFYGTNGTVDWSRASQWVLDNVKPHLGAVPDFNGVTTVRLLQSRRELADEVRAWIGDDPRPEFWGYYASWDWTALCWLMGGMMKTPSGWPMFCRDLRQSLDEHGHMNVRQPDGAIHHAMVDANWAACAFGKYLSATKE